MIGVIAIVLTLLIGLCVGSFLNVVIYRLPNNMSLIKPASHCPNCQNKIKWYDNIPLISYIVLRGKCRHCKCKISPRYLIVELTNMLLWFVALMFNTNFIFSSFETNYLMFALNCIAFSLLLCIFCCDLEHLEIPDELQMCLLIVAIVSLLSKDVDISSRVYGFLIGGGFLALFSLIFYLIKKREGIGFGDIKLMAVLGLLLGMKSIIVCIVLSAIFGAIGLSILSIAKKGEKNKEYPFAVFIAPCAIIATFLGEIIANWYLSLFVAL